MRSDTSSSSGLAKVLVEELVDQDELIPSKDFDLGPAGIASFSKIARLYRLATVLIALVSEEERNARCREARIEFEALVFPEERDDVLLEKVRYAMKDLADLLFVTQITGGASWAMRWLRSANVTETNPATLVLFATRWIDLYTAVVKTIREAMVCG